MGRRVVRSKTITQFYYAEGLVKRYIYWLPFCIVLALCAKNYNYFGSFGLTSWQPFWLYDMMLYDMPQAERDSLYEAGVISYPSTLEPFARLWHYGLAGATNDTLRWEHGYPNTPHRFVPILDVLEFEADGANMNHWVWLEIGKLQKQDALWALKNHPEIFLNRLKQAVLATLRPASDWFILEGHHDRRRHNYDVIFGGEK